MILAVAGLVMGVPGFFFGIYRTSRSGTWGAVVWSLLSVLGLIVVGASILALTVPGFFVGLL
jgi:hypothetical protein